MPIIGMQPYALAHFIVVSETVCLFMLDTELMLIFCFCQVVVHFISSETYRKK